MNNTFPSITVESGKVDARRYVERGTGLALFGAFFFAVIGTLIAVLVTYGIMLIMLLIYLMFAWYMKKLGRLNEYSADAVATALVGDKDIAFHGLLLLTVGYALLAYVNPESIIRQAREVAQNKYSKKAEHGLTHPLLLNRLQRILKDK